MTTTSKLQSRYKIARFLSPIAMGLFLAAIVAYNILIMERNFSSIFSIFSSRFPGIFIEALPFLLLGTVTSGLIAVFIQPDDLSRWLPKNPVLALFTAIFLGIVFPAGEYGVIPVVRRLFNKGLPVSIGITFLLTAPLINPLVLASGMIAFGAGSIFIARLLITILIALIIGMIFALNRTSDDILLAESLPVENDAPRPTIRDGLSQALHIAGNDFFEMGRLLVIGCVLAAALQTSVNQSELHLIGQGNINRILVMQGYAFILGVNSTVDSFVALSFMNTFSIGAIVAFLVSGSMLDIKTLFLLRGVFQKRAIVYLVILVILMNLLAAIIMNLQSSFL